VAEAAEPFNNENYNTFLVHSTVHVSDFILSILRIMLIPLLKKILELIENSRAKTAIEQINKNFNSF